MKTIAAVLIALLIVASPAAAQSSLEADLREAAAAYERKDMATAARLWKVWAAKGNAEARTLLGAMYWSGEGVPRDHKEAARLYLLAADQGYARAQNDIGFMLGFEGPPPHDDVEAYKWLTLAIQRYTAKNQDRLDQASEGQGHAGQPHDPGADRRGGRPRQGLEAQAVAAPQSRRPAAFYFATGLARAAISALKSFVQCGCIVLVGVPPDIRAEQAAVGRS